MVYEWVKSYLLCRLHISKPKESIYFGYSALSRTSLRAVGIYFLSQKSQIRSIALAMVFGTT